MPGVLLIEGMAQTAGALCVNAAVAGKPKVVYFMTIDNAKFRKPVVPGDRVEFHMTKINQRRNMWWYKGVAKVDGAGRLRGGSQRHARRRRKGLSGRDRTRASAVHPTRRDRAGRELGRMSRSARSAIVGAGGRARRQCRTARRMSRSPGRTSIGARTRIFPFASIGHEPQDLKFHGEDSVLTIGADCLIREGVTMNPGTEGGGLKTTSATAAPSWPIRISRMTCRSATT